MGTSMAWLLPWATGLIVVFTIVGIAIGRWPMIRADRTTIALLGVALLLACGAISLEQSFAALDLKTILLLFSMMIINAHLYIAGFFGIVAQRIVPFGLITAALSNLISNVPAVLVLQSLIPALPSLQRGWLILAATSTLAGNLTLLGSVANLIVAELAARWGVQLTFKRYLRAGVPITILTLMLSFFLI